MLKAIYPGSFDPVTNGHLDIIERASTLVDFLIVSILENPNKQSLFTAKQRKAQIESVTKHLPNVKVMTFRGLLVDFAKAVDAKLIIRGIRAITDFEDEFQRALVNKCLNPDIETIFISATAKNMFLSSSAVKETAVFGGNIDFMVPEQIRQQVTEKYEKRGV